MINSLGAFRSVLIKLTVQPTNPGAAAAAETGPMALIMDTGAALKQVKLALSQSRSSGLDWLFHIICKDNASIFSYPHWTNYPRPLPQCRRVSARRRQRGSVAAGISMTPAVGLVVRVETLS